MSKLVYYDTLLSRCISDFAAQSAIRWHDAQPTWGMAVTTDTLQSGAKLSHAAVDLLHSAVRDSDLC